jgi:hypothetical protein
MKKTLVILLLLSVGRLCFSQEQNVFNYNYPLAWQYDSHAMINLNNNYYICGNVARQEMPCIYWLMGFHVSKINSDGIFDTIRYFDKCERGTYTGFLSQTMCTKGDSICIIGNVSTDSLTIAFILLLNEDLDTINNHNIFSDTLTRRMHAVIPKNNSFITCGCVDSSYNAINNPTPSLTYTQALISEIEHNGEIKWTKDYRFDTNGGNCWSVFHDLCITPDNGIIVLGITYDLGSPRRNLIMKTDSLGNQQWVRFFGNSSYTNPFFTDIIPTHDSCYIVCGAYTYGEIGGGYYPYDSWILKIDNNGNTKWDRKHRDSIVYDVIANDYYGYYRGVVEKDNGDLLAICNTYSDEDSVFIGQGFRIRCLDSFGNKKWDKVITRVGNQGGPLWPQSIQLTDDNGIAIGGWADIYYYDELNHWVSDQRIFLIKTDSLGNDTLISDISPVESKPITEFKLECYPNPASREFFVDLPQGTEDDVLEIYSTSGSLVHEQAVGYANNKIDICGLQPGMYLVKIRGAALYGKIIIE